MFFLKLSGIHINFAHTYAKCIFKGFDRYEFKARYKLLIEYIKPNLSLYIFCLGET